MTLFYCTHEGRSGVPVLPPRQGRDRFGAPRAEAPQVGFPTSSPIRQRQRPSIRFRHGESMRCLDQPKRLMQMPPQPELRSCACPPKAQASSPLPSSRTQPDDPSRQDLLQITRQARTAPPLKVPRQPDQSTPGDQRLQHERAQRGARSPIRTTTPATTLGKGRSR